MPTKFLTLSLPLLVLGACTLAPHVSETKPPAPASGLHEIDGRYTLDQPFTDFYDSAFVLTDGGKTPPRVVDVAQLAGALIAYDVVVYGETHEHPGVHLAQMQVLRALYQRDPRWVVSFEQFERDTQGVLDDYVAGRIGETTLIDKGRAWKNYLTSYRPLLLFAKDHQLPVVAAEAPTWAVNCVGQLGTAVFKRFTPTERTWVATDVQAEPGAYRDKFMSFMGNSTTHGGNGGASASTAAAARAERTYAAQVTRDDTMAESIDRALKAHPGYKVLHFTGSFHAEGFLGTVERLRRIDPALKVAVIDALEVENPKKPGFPEDDAKDGTVLQLVYPTPDDFAPGEDTSAFSAKVAHDHDRARCKYTPARAP